MEAESESKHCPLCGAETRDISPHQMAVLRSIVLSDILPALLHDGRHMLRALEHGLHDFARRPERAHEAMFRRDATRALGDLEKLFDTLRQLCRSPAVDNSIPLAELPELVHWVLGVFEVRAELGMQRLSRSDGRVLVGAYWDTLIFALHAALLSLRQDRHPIVRLRLDVRDRQLVTRLEMHHYGDIQTESLGWTGLRWAVERAGGAFSTSGMRDSTVVQWSMPLAEDRNG